ncbi:tRNA lysidine(34) synthetase TilS [Bacillus sp. MUM 116]|uniref:tRNA lysidine(34) synthetase TilS n=1 Tax=Bacillus sp. MUM 116 TaxID=1678002 RepID=UPI0008F5B7D5|nr:tRNA lysidine(34) synthetase TilS [Bacillus sp. MUM 116]OIK16714.1 tRNA lysidine(34) synthetase TilS [Bacillus sp. MUM 116]
MLESKVMDFLDRHFFSLNNKKIVVGVSGGPDSLALLRFLWGHKDKRNLSIVAAHVDHMFRGQESLDDAMFVKDYCEQHHISFEMSRINIPMIMERTGKSSQVAAREERYKFFQTIMEKYDYPYLALAHHGDDQIETMLMRMTRGSTGKARAGIPFKRYFYKGMIFRPFLTLTKEEIEDYCRKNELTPRIDPSNKKDIYSRNRFRKEVLPFLKRENPNVHEHFQRFSEDLQSDEEFLQELTVQNMNKVMTIREKSNIVIDIKRFLDMPLPLQRRGIQLILNYLYKEKPSSLSAVHIEQIFSMIHHSGPSGKLDFPNELMVIRSYQNMSFQFKAASAQEYYFEVHGDSRIELPNGGSIKVNLNHKEPLIYNSYSAVFNAAEIKWPLVIRTREIGDRMSLKGMSGTKKLKDIFIDYKVPLQERDTWPVITDGNKSIIWLPGLKKSAMEGIDSSATQYLLLTYTM